MGNKSRKRKYLNTRVTFVEKFRLAIGYFVVTLSILHKTHFKFNLKPFKQKLQSFSFFWLAISYLFKFLFLKIINLLAFHDKVQQVCLSVVLIISQCFFQSFYLGDCSVFISYVALLWKWQKLLTYFNYLFVVVFYHEMLKC